MCLGKSAEVALAHEPIGRVIEVVAIAEIKQYIVPLVVEELRSVIIPTFLNALQMTEVQLNTIADHDKNNVDSNIDEQLHSTTTVPTND